MSTSKTHETQVAPPGTLVTGEGLGAGYVLVAPSDDTMTYLLDKKTGKVHHTWTSVNLPGLAVYLLPNGNLLRAEDIRSQLPPGAQSCGYPGGLIAMYDWHGKLLWSCPINTPTQQQTHDVFPMPNGNVLVDVWEYIDASDPKMRTTCPPSGGLWSGMIIELEPDGKGSATQVWQWRFWDHLLGPNQSPASSYPHRIDANYLGTPPGMNNWTHVNAVTYDEALDQIIISSRNLNEIYIIEHTSSSDIAAGSTGGKYGRGGDFLYRWGNPAAYGVDAPQQLFGQHSPYWLRADSANAHKILVNNDGFVGEVSNCQAQQGTANPTSFVVIDAPFHPKTGRYHMKPGEPWGPASADLLATIPSSDYQCTFEGSVQLLDNGNLMICSGLTGYLYELALGGSDGPRVVWQFNLSGVEGAFRCHHYSHEYVEQAAAGGSS